VALFGKKKDEPEDSIVEIEGDGSADLSSSGDAVGFSADKASKFFEAARTRYETSNYEYAAQLWLQGLRWDPTDFDAVDGFWKTVQELARESKRKAPSKELAKAASDAKGPVRRFLQELTNASFRWDDAQAVLKGAEAAVGVDSPAVADLLGQRAYTLSRQDKKPRKDAFVRLLAVFRAAGNFKLAVESGELARQLDPSDADLQHEVRNMMAQQTMSSGGFDQAGQEGGFRRNIRDAAKQAELEAADRITKTEDVKDRLVEVSQREYEADPENPVAIDKFGKALRQRGKASDLLTAWKVYNRAYGTTKQFRFRQAAGEIRIRQAKAAIAQQSAKVQARPDDQDEREKLESQRKQLAAMELEELKLAEENYPTDLPLKFRLGVALFERGQYGDSIEYFQAAQSDPKNRSRVLYYMGRAFGHIEGWENEAIQTLRRAIDEHEDKSSDVSLELRYDLMTVLKRKAEKDRDRGAAEEADELAAAIAMQKFSFRDIRDQRNAIKKLLDELKD
jgi:hypothetical protein